MNIERTCFGLAITDALLVEEADFVPLEILVVVKTMEEGELGHHIFCTPQLNTTEALGMMAWAELMLKTAITRHINKADEE